MTEVYRATDSGPGETEVVPARTVREYIRGIGPGLVVAMMWLGTGDLVSSSVSGANYGYAFIWILVIATLARFVVTSALARYQLCNAVGDETILHGYARLWRGFPLALSIGGSVLAFGYNAALIQGSALALYNLCGRPGGAWTIFGFACIVAGVTLFMTTRKQQYKALEWAAAASVIVLSGTFLVTLGFAGVDLGSAAKGIAFGFPANQGPISAIVLMVSVIGAVGGSTNNLVYVYFTRAKGWRGPTFRRQQILDLLVGTVGIIVIDVAIWMVAARVLFGTGHVISTPDDLAGMMRSILGPVGGVLLWIGIIGAAYDGYPSAAWGYGRMVTEAAHQTFEQRAARYPQWDKDPLFRRVQWALIIAPLVLVIPGAPSFIVTTIGVNALAVVLVPPVIVGLLWLGFRRKLYLSKYRPRLWENVILLIIGLIGLWSTISLIREFVTGGLWSS